MENKTSIFGFWNESQQTIASLKAMTPYLGSPKNQVVDFGSSLQLIEPKSSKIMNIVKEEEMYFESEWNSISSNESN